MDLTLQLQYASAADLRAHLFEHSERGAVLLPWADPPPELPQYAPLALEVTAGQDQCSMGGEVLQVLAGTGVVVRLVELAAAEALVASAPIAEPAQPPTVTAADPAQAEGVEDTGDDPSSEDAATGKAAFSSPSVGPHIAGSSPVSWSFEQLQASWDQLTVAEKVRVARHGKRPARMMILKGLDKTLHVHVLHNPGVTPEEIALMASMSNLDPTVLRRIAADTQWLRHLQVARNLVTNPKLTLPQITKIIKHLPRDELSRLARTGKVRGSVKQLIVKTLDRTR